MKVEDETVELVNVFARKPKQLDKPTRRDLLEIRPTGRARFVSFVRQFALSPPTEPVAKRSRKKLRTFTVRTTISKEQSKVKKATRLLTCAYSHVIQSGAPFVQTCPYPLGIATETGSIRQRPKSSVREAFAKDPVMAALFTNSCPLLTSADNCSLDIIFDFMRFIHQPPPPDILSVEQFAHHLWEKVVMGIGFRRGADRVTVVVDKPQYLPPPRALLHNADSTREAGPVM